MRIVSFNVQHHSREAPHALRKRMKACAAFLHSHNPDILCLQEVDPAGWPVLEKALNPYAAAYCPRLDGMDNGEATPVICLSNEWKAAAEECFWFSETPAEPSRGWDAAHPRVCSMLKLRHAARALPDLWILGLHLDHAGRVARSKSLELLGARVGSLAEGGNSIVVCGDFNMPAIREPLRGFLATSPVLCDSTHHHPLGALKPTYLGWGWFRLARARIDHVLHSRDWKAAAYQACRARDADGRLLSDHRAVVVDFDPA